MADNNDETETEQRYFSPETRAKLAAAARARWARVRAAGFNTLAEEAEVEAAAEQRKAEEQRKSREVPLMTLYHAAAAVATAVPDDLRSAIVECAQTSTIMRALSEANEEGTSLQKKLRVVLNDTLMLAMGWRKNDEGGWSR